MYKLFLCLRYLRKRRIAFFAVAAVCLCVAMVLIVVSVMGGFLQMVKDRSRGMLADLVAENGTLQGFAFYDEFIDRLKTEMPDDVAMATPVIITYGVLRFPEDQYTKPVQIVGMRLQETYAVNDFRKGLFYEKYYPGSTTLGPQKEPAFGFDEAGQAILPPDLEAAWQTWFAQAGPRERDKAPIDPTTDYERPGYYRPIPPEQLAFGPGPTWLEPELPGVIIGTDMIAEPRDDGGYDRLYLRGTKVTLTFVPFTEGGQMSTGLDAPRRLFRYADDNRTGIYDIDSMSAYIDFDLLQDVVEMDPQKTGDAPDAPMTPARATQVQIKLRPGLSDKQILAARDRASAIWDKIVAERAGQVSNPRMLERVRIRTWEEKQRHFINAVEKEKVLVTTLFGVISVVAVFLVGCIFYMIVQQKTRDIGVVKSVGATSGGVAAIFVGYGAAVGVVGGAVGTLIGTLFVWYINDIQDLLVKLSPELRVWSPQVYSFDRIPNVVSLHDVVVIYAIAIVASMVGSVIAAWRAARIWPVEALRYE